MGVLLPVKAGESFHLTAVDDDIADALEGKSLSLGSHGYAQSFFAGRVDVLHRWIMGCRKGDGRIVDHINRDRLDNRRQNLRLVSASENNQNWDRRPLAGAYPTRHGRFTAKVGLQGRQHYLGTYDTAEQAAAVAAEFRRQHFLQQAS